MSIKSTVIVPIYVLITWCFDILLDEVDLFLSELVKIRHGGTPNLVVPQRSRFDSKFLLEKISKEPLDGISPTKSLKERFKYFKY